jgi:hypothetical protein
MRVGAGPHLRARRRVRVDVGSTGNKECRRSIGDAGRENTGSAGESGCVETLEASELYSVMSAQTTHYAVISVRAARYTIISVQRPHSTL